MWMRMVVFPFFLSGFNCPAVDWQPRGAPCLLLKGSNDKGSESKPHNSHFNLDNICSHSFDSKSHLT